MNMAKLELSLIMFSLFLLSSNSGGFLKFTHGQVAGQASWCVAKPSVPNEILQRNIDYVCSNPVIDCKIIQPGGSCYEPNEVGNRASVVMNLYYQKYGRHNWECDFNKTGVLAITDPSYDGCKYAFGA